MDKKYVVDGFEFLSEAEYNAAKEELTAINFFKEKTDLSDLSTVIKLYNRILARNTFHTVVGYSFLKELQNTIILSSKNKLKDLENIHVKAVQGSEENRLDLITAEKFKELAKKEKTKHRNSRIINLFLTLTIIIMFIIALYSDKTVFKKFENDIIDEYASWEEELTQREEELDKREEKLNNQGN